MNIKYAKSHPELFNRLLLIRIIEERLDEITTQQAQSSGSANWAINQIRIEELNHLLLHDIFKVKI